MRVLFGVSLCVLIAAVPGTAEEEAKPASGSPSPTPEQAADQVLEAVEADDPKTLQALAALDEPEAWIVVDLLVARGRRAEARALAAAAPGHLGPALTGLARRGCPLLAGQDTRA